MLPKVLFKKYKGQAQTHLPLTLILSQYSESICWSILLKQSATSPTSLNIAGALTAKAAPIDIYIIEN